MYKRQVIHLSDEHFIAVCKNERYRMALLESDKPFNVFLRDATFINGPVAGGKAIASVYGDIPVSYTHLDVYKRQVLVWISAF